MELGIALTTYNDNVICDLTPSHLRTILSSLAYLRHPFSISVFGSTMYWSEWDTHAIYQVGDTLALALAL